MVDLEKFQFSDPVLAPFHSPFGLMAPFDLAQWSLLALRRPLRHEAIQQTAPGKR
jgi:hypothetical protein